MQSKMTRHASDRRQQRGIPPILIDLLMEMGSSQPAKDGASLLFFDKRARRRLASYAGTLASSFEEHLNVFAIVSGQQVITTGHRYERIRRV